MVKGLIKKNDPDFSKVKKKIKLKSEEKKKFLNFVLSDLTSLSSDTLDMRLENPSIDLITKKNNLKHEKKSILIRSNSNYQNTFRKRIVFDNSYLKSCSFYKQFIILNISIIIMTFNFIIRSSLSSSSDILVNNLQIIISILTNFILIGIIFFYLFHYVGKFSQESWLKGEFYLYLILTIVYFIDSIMMFFSSHNFIWQGFLGIILVLNFIALAVTKKMMAHLKISAQQRIEDPDGNLERAKAPNLRFSFPKQSLLRVWTA